MSGAPLFTLDHEGRIVGVCVEFVLFFNLFTLVIFIKVDNISSHC